MRRLSDDDWTGDISIVSDRSAGLSSKGSTNARKVIAGARSHAWAALVWLPGEEPEAPVLPPGLVLPLEPVWPLERDAPPVRDGLPVLGAFPEPGAFPDGPARHSAAASEHWQQDARAPLLARGSAERAVPLAGVPTGPDVLQAGPVRSCPVRDGPARSCPGRGARARFGPGEPPRWAALPEQRVLRVWVRRGEPPPERAGLPAAKSAGCGQPGKPPDAHRGQP